MGEVVVTKTLGEDPHDPTGDGADRKGKMQQLVHCRAGIRLRDWIWRRRVRGSENCLPAFFASRTLNYLEETKNL